jgi:hypothetical protein
MRCESLYLTSNEVARLHPPRTSLDWHYWHRATVAHARRTLRLTPALAEEIAAAGLEGVWLAYSDHDSPPRSLTWRYARYLMTRALNVRSKNFNSERRAIARRYASRPPPPPSVEPLPDLPILGIAGATYNLMRRGLTRTQVAAAIGRAVPTVCQSFTRARRSMAALLIAQDPERFRRLLPRGATSRKEPLNHG